MSYSPPCSSPDADPNDWFITREGKQYSDDELTTRHDVLLGAVNALGYVAGDEIDQEAWNDLAERLELDAKKDALKRRRQAKDRCFECYLRTNCLDSALQENTPATHGTWGGYYEEELRAIRVEIARRKQRKLYE